MNKTLTLIATIIVIESAGLICTSAVNTNTYIMLEKTKNNWK
ncbi:hypothetical protein EELLY_v1c01250 [Entomoplasma ellychniae]|uniref:Uncharacterized protein n=1 Tax=Entomoplasma ellychniae TaxID=2114 RepID=A0A8E2QYZ0_9MOLU|nr:hypothetical protein [Entomoplasma ellychniae]PPE04450.1 hypothetical protein EELLY_v1c01250 [Entomoplasma ellychniae]